MISAASVQIPTGSQALGFCTAGFRTASATSCGAYGDQKAGAGIPPSSGRPIAAMIIASWCCRQVRGQSTQAQHPDHTDARDDVTACAG